MVTLDDESFYGLGVITSDPDPKVKARFELFKSLDQKTYQTYQDAFTRVRRAMTGGIKVYAAEGLRQLEGMTSSIRVSLSQGNTPQLQASLEGWRHSISCGVLTFVAALHLFQEQTMNQVQKSNPENADAVKRARNVFSEKYDQSLDYRLAFRLRNVMVHHSMDCVGLTASSVEDRTPAGLIVHRHTVGIPLLRTVFLGTKQGVSAKLRQELQDLEDDPDLLDVSRGAYAAIDSIFRDLFSLIHPKIRSDLELIRELEDLFEDKQGEKILARIPDASKVRVGKRPLQLPHITLSEQVFIYARSAGGGYSAGEG